MFERAPSSFLLKSPRHGTKATNTRKKILAAAHQYVGVGAFRQDLSTSISYPTESSTVRGRIALKSYLDEVIEPKLLSLGCSVARYDSWRSGLNSFAIGTRTKNPELRTVLCYGHADVVDDQAAD